MQAEEQAHLTAEFSTDPLPAERVPPEMAGAVAAFVAALDAVYATGGDGWATVPAAEGSAVEAEASLRTP